MRLTFALPRPFSHDQLRALFEAVGHTLTGQPIALTRRDHVNCYDANHGNACFFTRWIDGPITFEQTVETGEGNPYDGYPYLLSAQLKLASHTVSAWQGGMDTHFTTLSLRVEPGTRREWLALRETLRRELGAERDQCTPSELPAEPPSAEEVSARVRELELLLKRLRASNACLVNYDMWERWGESSSAPDYAAQMRAEAAAARSEEATVRPQLEALIARTLSELPAALTAWVGLHDAYLAEVLADCEARSDELDASRARATRAKWLELREGKRAFVEESVLWPNRERYQRVFEMDP